MKRVLCAWLPDFPIQRLRRVSLVETADGERAPLSLADNSNSDAGTGHDGETATDASPSHQEYVLYAESANRAVVTTCSSGARHCQVQPGMSLAEAQALLESATFLPHDTTADLQELQLLADLCHFYSPLVSLDLSDETHCLLLDISGCAHLFDTEAGLVRQLVVCLAQQGYFAHVAVGNTVGAAWAVARYGHRTGTRRRLKSLPVEALRLPEKLITQLHEFDLRTIGQLTDLPADTLPSRFGSLLTERLDQLLGRRDELLTPLRTREPVSREWSSDDPICHQWAIEQVCTELLTEVLDTLQSRNEGLLKLELTLSCESGDSSALEIGLARPTNSRRHILKLLELRLESATRPEWIHCIRLEALLTAVLSVHQRSLFDLQDPVADDNQVQRLTDRLGNRLGPQAVVRPDLQPEILPEQVVTFLSLSSAAARPVSGQSPVVVDSNMAASRPLILFPDPQSICVDTTSSAQALKWFRHAQRQYHIVRQTEPERIQTDWWQDTGTVHRDYYQVETESGSRFWLFCDSANHWFLHGIFE